MSLPKNGDCWDSKDYVTIGFDAFTGACCWRSEVALSVSLFFNFAHVLLGLMYLHNERHVIHRDIKPSNLLMNRKGEVKITNFGVSAVLASSMDQRDTFVGTYNYMSPERIKGSTYDYSSDIWSLGMVVLECAIGRFPYLQSEDQEGGPSYFELLEAVVESPPPSGPVDQFSPEFCSFIYSCLKAVGVLVSWLIFKNPICASNAGGCAVTLLGCTFYGYVRHLLSQKSAGETSFTQDQT